MLGNCEECGLKNDKPKCVKCKKDYFLKNGKCLGEYTINWFFFHFICKLLLPSSLTHLPLGQNGRHFANNIFKCIFVNEKFYVLIPISLKFASKGSIGNESALVQVMVWRRTGNKPLPKTKLALFTDAFIWHQGAKGKTIHRSMYSCTNFAVHSQTQCIQYSFCNLINQSSMLQLTNKQISHASFPFNESFKISNLKAANAERIQPL